MNCSATNRNGRPCNAHAIRHSDPPLCSAHAGRNVGAGAPAGNQNRTDHGFYGRVYTLEEMADLIAHTADITLDDELAATRVSVRRVMERLRLELPSEEYAKLAGLVFTGANTIARLLRTRHLLSGDSADGIAGAIAQALDELGAQFELPL